MGVLDKFLNAMKMNDDDGFGDDYLDDDYDEYEDVEEERPKKRLLPKYNNDEDYDMPPVVQAAVPQERPQPMPKPKAMPKPQPKAKVSPIRSKKNGDMEVCVIRPKSVDDEREIADTLLEECTVILNMEGLDIDMSQRIIDFACGACYALNGNLQRISNYIFILTPESVDISGDFQEMLSGAFDVPSFGTRF